MTEKEFSQALRRGLGRAIVELKNSKNKAAYRDIILRCCLRDISYDWQVEGTKGYYLYDAILASEAQVYIEKAVIDKFLSRCPDGLFRQLAAILYCSAAEGSELAKNALHDKYNYFAAKKGRLVKSPSVDEGFQWDEVAFHLLYIDGFSTFKRYAEDVGEIRYKNPDNRKSYDGWYKHRAEGRFGKERIDDFFNSMYEKSYAIKALVDTIKVDDLSIEKERERKEQEPTTVYDLSRAAKEAATDKNPRFKMYRLLENKRKFASKASDEEFLELTHAALSEKNETVKALLLNQFWLKQIPLDDITPLMGYAQSENLLLAEVAIDCLKGFKDKRLHDLAIQLLITKGLGSFALGLLIENYKKTDDVIIAELIKKASNIPHHVQQDLRDIYQRRRSANAFPILLRVYNKGECSFCRFGIVEAMHHSHVLPDEILSECLFDSYEDTRKFAERLMKRGLQRAGKANGS